MNEYVAGKVSLPGTLMQVFGVVAILANIWSLVVFFLQIGLNVVSALMEGNTEAAIAIIIASAVSAVIGMLFPIVSLVIGLLIIMGGSKLKSTSSPGLVYAAAVFMMLPCCTGSLSLWIVGFPCCCVGLPLAIWVIMTMQDEQVKAAFAESA